jgi:hypothetical protein
MVAGPFSLVCSSFGNTGPPQRTHRSWHGPCRQFMVTTPPPERMRFDQAQRRCPASFPNRRSPAPGTNPASCVKSSPRTVAFRGGSVIVEETTYLSNSFTLTRVAARPKAVLARSRARQPPVPAILLPNGRDDGRECVACHRGLQAFEQFLNSPSSSIRSSTAVEAEQLGDPRLACGRAREQRARGMLPRDARSVDSRGKRHLASRPSAGIGWTEPFS